MKEIRKKNQVFDPDYMGTLISKYAKTFLNFNVGDNIKGKVMQITKDEVYIDVGEEIEGIIPIEELSLMPIANPKEIIKENEEIECIILDVQSDNGKLILSKKLVEEENNWNKLKNIFSSKGEVEVEIIRPVRGGLVALCFGLEGFIPESCIAADSKDNDGMKNLLHQKMKCNILELDLESKKLIFSQIVEKEKNKQIKDNDVAVIKVGDIIKGKVMGIASYGVFIDLQGAKGLIHISELSWGKVNNPKEVVLEGQEVEVLVLKIEKEYDRISLSLKKLQKNPWENEALQNSVGSLVKGEVEKIIRAGALVKLENSLVGLIPGNELEVEKKESGREIKVGDKLETKIVNILPSEQKMFLSIREAQEEKMLQSYKEQAEKDSKTELGEIFDNILKKENNE